MDSLDVFPKRYLVARCENGISVEGKERASILEALKGLCEVGGAVARQQPQSRSPLLMTDVYSRGPDRLWCNRKEVVRKPPLDIDSPFLSINMLLARKS